MPEAPFIMLGPDMEKIMDEKEEPTRTFNDEQKTIFENPDKTAEATRPMTPGVSADPVIPGSAEEKENSPRADKIGDERGRSTG